VRYRSQIAEFSIIDTGIGIREEDLERVFEPFERGQGAAVRAVPGTGLGLTITRLLTRIMGGDITVTSRYGEGSCFRVQLLLSEAMHSGGPEADRRPVAGYAGPRIKVLLADDDQNHLELMRNILQPLGFLLFIASDAATCLDLAAQCEPDLALLDISMPGESGWDIAEAIRRSRGDSVRIMMVSANAYEAQGPGDGRAPHDDFLAKPIDIQDLLDKIQALTGLEWTHALPVAPVAGAPAPPAEAAMPAAASRHIDDLQQLGRIGYIRGIETKLRDMEAEDAANGPFVERLRALVRKFDLKGFMKVLDEAKATETQGD
jgi:CheY-like chemotaxis protein